MWRLGFLFHEMAFGLFSVFLPLYIISIGGSLLDIGGMTFAASLASIPAFFFWVTCATNHNVINATSYFRFYPPLFCYTFSLSTNVNVLMALYVVISVFHAAHEPPKNVLIAEFYTREEWEKAYALYEGFTEIGWLTGLCTGIFIFSSANFDAKTTLLICSGSNFLAFVLSLFLVADPIIVFERGLVNIEKGVGFVHKGATLASKILEGLPTHTRLKMENVYAFCPGGLTLFSFATNILLTPLPVFFSKNLNLPTCMVYAVYVSNSAASAIGYFFASNRLERHEERERLQMIVLMRSLFSLLFAGFTALSFGTAIFATLILTLMGFAYALYHVAVLSLSMELIPAGKAGIFDVLISSGSAIGAFIGPFIAQTWGFTYAFLFAGMAFLLAYASFKLHS